MKKLAFGLAFAVFAAIATAAEANITVVKSAPLRAAEQSEGWTPLSLNLVTPVGLPWGFGWDVRGLQIGLWNDVPNFDGLQIGIANKTENFRGLQLGVINYTYKMYGMQLGLINVIEDNDVPFLPILNCYF